MANAKIISRRVAIAGGFAGAGFLVANATSLTANQSLDPLFQAVEDWTKITQRGLLYPDRLAREYSPADISPVFKPNGTYNPGTDEYNRHVAENFFNWRLKVDGLVSNPLSLSVADLKRLPQPDPNHPA